MDEVIHPGNEPIAYAQHRERDIRIAAFVGFEERDLAEIPEKKRCRDGEKDDDAQWIPTARER